MYKWTKSLLIITAIFILGLNYACQAPEKGPATPAANTSPTVKEPAQTGSSGNNPSNAPASTNVSTSPSSPAASTLSIKSIRVTSPSRADVVVYPPSSRPTENSTVTARVWETLDLECVAQDEPSHKLTYAWSCNAGKLRGDSSKVTWTAPGAGGDYTVTVKVTCDKGESAVLTFNVTVKCCGN